MKKIELLAPAGDLQRLKIAIMYGADAVYIGGKQFSLRSRASNFSIEDIAEGVKFANLYGAHVHVTVNMLPHEEDLSGLKEYLISLEAIGVTAIICASYAIAKCAKQYAPKLEVHMSTQHSITNSAAIRFWNTKKFDRIVLARELTLEQILATTANSPLPIEVFIHGGMCISYSGRCVLSNHMTGRDANRGGCAQSCRWKYRLYDGEQEIHDEKNLFSMSSKDLMALAYLPDLIRGNVASLKIEGRMKSSYYIATLIHTYRMCIDEFYEKKELSLQRIQYYIEQLKKAENRPVGSGFYLGLPNALDHLYGINGAGVTKEFLAYVLDYDQTHKEAIVEVRNKFTVGTVVEVLSPHETVQQCEILYIKNEQGEVLETANQPTSIVRIPIPFVVKKHAMIRNTEKQNRDDVY